ncbi:dynein intermediate chain 3, ciliary isoform X1 [Scaptodrosophila lebanonensis]|uniref:Dynein intermediate chain 3, ciliary isoform X1 n=1 Tax=Drosophila lebanonensis TaxID=7225 RepID=A0A6J2TD94_DROLE|nr:dynein intermediate chain 3, ciliary isoform X1 [Scaptodrosophila lebanonensis]
MEYIYKKERRTFGARVHFEDKDDVVFSENSNPEMVKNFILKNPVDRVTQYAGQTSLSVANTERATYKSTGITHNEGGWPKDINMQDPEQTVRYKRKIEKDENYITQVMNLTKPMEHYIYQNNAVNIYENYFENLDPAPLPEPCKSRTVNVYRDPNPIKVPVKHLSWSPDGGIKIAVSHCDMKFQGDKIGQKCSSYIWDVENPNEPFLALEPKVSCVCLEYNQKDPTSLVSGMYNGQVAAWDTRYGKNPVMISEREVCHRDPVNSVLWNNSKSGTEFFSGSSDGQVLWWDTRKLSEPHDRLLMDPVRSDEQDLSRSYGISVLEYETTIPTRFMTGTEMGMLFSCNRKGKTPTEKIQIRMMCHLGPVYAITRNPAFVKNFLTVGDWCARIWSEDCRESSIIWTKSCSSMLTDGAWSYTKVSQFFITRMDGVLDTWDLLQQQNEPVLTVKVCDEPLNCVRTNENGKFVSCGSQLGATFLIEVSDNMVMSAKNDKPLLTAMFERENRREKILEAKSRESKLKVKATHGQDQADLTMLNGKVNMAPFAAICEQAASEYFAAVEQERLRRLPGGKQDAEEVDVSEAENSKL